MSMLAVSQNVLPPETNVCYNCFRTKDGVCVVLNEVARDENIRMKLKFCNVKDKRVDKTPDKRRNYNKMFLCMECETYLTNKQHGNEYCYYWPALCWRILICDRVVRNCVFAHFAWQMLPRKWRIWWLAEVKKIRRIETVGYRQQRTVEVYEDVTLDYPAPFFDDVTDCYLEILDVEKELDVTKLLQYWDDFCAWPSVKCPWGCTEFLSDCGMIAFDDVYSHFCDPFAWCSKDLERTKTCGESKRMDKLLGARPDFLQSIGSLIPGAEDCMLIKRCIVIDKCKGPCVMTCKDHNGGSTEMYIHPPTNPATLQYPSCHGDQLAPAVFMPRLIRNFKKRGFSNTYQVHQIHSGYNGIDTCNIQEMGMFDITSDILYKNEGLIVANRSDLKNHVHFLHKQGILNQTAFDEIMASGESWADGSREKDKQQQFALSGSTMLTFVDALQLQEVLSHPHVCSNLKRIHYNGYDEAIVRRHVFPVALLGGGQDTDHVNNDSNILEQQCGLTITRQQRVDEDKNMSVSSSSSSAHSDSSGHEDRDRTRKQLNCPFRPIWPPALFQVHPYSAHGASPLYSKSIWHLFQENDTEGSTISLVSMMCFIVGSIPQLWQVVDTCVEKDTEWFGWFLQIVTKYNLIPYLKKAHDKENNNPYYLGYKKKHDCIANLENMMRAASTMEMQSNTARRRNQPVSVQEKCSSLLRTLGDAITTVKITSQSHQSLRNIDRWLQDINTNCQYLVVYRDKLSIDNTDIDFCSTVKIGSDGHTMGSERMEFKACFMMQVMSELVSETLFCCRNLHDMFKEWWCVPYNCDKPYRAELYSLEGQQDDEYAVSVIDNGEYLPVKLLKSWDFLIYVRQYNNQLGQLRDHYYTSLGGQLHVCCGIHEFPLVFAAFKNTKRCHCVSQCQHSVIYECVVHECNVGLCRKHFDDFEKQSVEENNGQPIYFTPDADVSLILHDSTSVFDSDSQKSSIDDSDSGNRNEGFEGDNGEYSQSVYASSSSLSSYNDNDSMSSSSSSSSSDHGILLESDDSRLSKIAKVEPENMINDAFEFMVNPITEDDLMDDGEDWVESIPALHIKNTAAGTGTSDVNITVKGGQKIHAYILINSFGKCLIRRGKRISGNKTERSFLQRISATHNDSIPLLYPEGMLFPSIFWKTSIKDQSLIGALPGCLLIDNKSASKLNFAGAPRQFQTRMKNNQLKCSTDFNYAGFVFSVMSNIELRGIDTRVTVKRRGAQAIFGDSGPAIQNDSSAHVCNRYVCEVIDSDKSVNCLATMNRHMNAGLFYTHTLNQTHHPGVRIITALVEKKCQDIDETMNNGNVSPVLIEEYKQALRQALSNVIFRSYRKVMELAIDWILHSPDEPLGKIKAAWIVSEFSEDSFKPTGNMEHFHMVFYLEDDISQPEVLEKVRSRVRCSIEHLFDDQDIRYLMLKGIIQSLDDLQGLKSLASVLLNHHCDRDTKLCKRITSHKKEVCRRPHYANLNPCINSYGYVPIPIQFDPEAEKILLKLGMLKIDPIHKRVIPNDTRLEAGIHVYPTNHDFHFSPVNPALFAIFQSTMNLQICDKSLATRYLTNYTSRVDTRTRAVFSSNQQTGNVQVQIMDIPTTKIASNRNQENQAKLSDRIKEKPQGVLISLPEMFRRIFNKKQIICTETFTAFPTLPLEERVGMLKRPKLHFATATDCINYVYENRSLPGFAQMHKVSSIETRRTILKLSIDRQFSASQELLIRDQYSSPVTIDNITAHGIRPPELRQFYFPQHYVQYFYWKHPSVREKTLDSGRRVSITEQLVGHDIFTSAWIDGMERQVFVRKAAIDVILSTYSSKLPCDMMLLFHALHYLSKNQFHLNATEEMQQSVILKLSSQQQQDSTCISTLFLTKEDQDDKLPLPVIIPVKPNRPQKFLISLILSLGHFDNEIELWHATSLHEVFYNASLIPFHPSVRLPSLDEIDNILKMYVDRFLLYIPASWHTLNKYLIMAQSIIKDALHHNAVLDLGIPGNTYSSLYQIVTNECQAYIQQLKRTLVETLTVMIPHGPTIEEFMAATKEQPLQWEPTFRQVEGQSDDSYHEQQMAFNFIREKIDAYCKCQRIARRGTILHGHAGSGKTTIQSYVILYQISRGLLSTSTALASKRSRENGGIHIHQLLKIINSKRATTAAGQYSSDKVIDHLWKYPEVVNYLRTMDCLNLDEGGQTDAELFSVIDSALRYIRNSSDYFGGILSTITIDINQCGTMNNTRPLWCSPNIITSYDVIELQGFVRSCQDNPQQELILISEKTVRTMQDKQLFHDIIASHCQWYASWSDASISSDMLRIFGKRAAVNKHENEFIDKHIRPNNISVVIRRSEDEECIRSLYNQWSPATPRTSTKLNALVKEQNSLLLYYNAVGELTFNKKNHWDQGQVAIIRSHITQEDADHWAPVLIAVAKVGTNIIPSDLDTVSNNDLCEMGWTFETVSKHQTQEQTISLEVLGRRTQYPFRSRNASTIHKVMGSTLYKGITQVSNDPSSDYYLWEKGLVVVLLTRFRQLKHLAFVDPLGIKHTTDVLLEILDKVPSYYYHSKHVLDNIKKTFHRHDNIDVQQQQSNAVVVGSMTTDAASSSTIPSLSTMIPEINLNFFPYCPKDYPISTAQATPHGFLYMLLSLADRRSFYIGQTTDLRKRLHAHNKILSASGADPRYRPWVPLVYFTGFQSSTERRAMEHKWQQERNRLLSHDSNTSIMDVINIGIRLCSSCRRLEETPNSETFQDHEPCLVLHRCYSAHVA